jgi:outer membrane protein assembly factor BamB
MYLSRCSLIVAVFAAALPPLSAADWPQWFGPKRDGYWHETGILKEFPKEGPKVRWRVPIDLGYSGPAVVGDRVYITDWVRDKDADGNEIKPTKEDGTKGVERVLCLDAKTGKTIWEHQYRCNYFISYRFGPRTTPVIEEGKLWVLGAMGDLLCLEVTTGKPIWIKNLAREYDLKTELPADAFKQDVDPDKQAEAMSKIIPVWGYSASLLIDGDLLYSLVGGPGSAIVAFDKRTGKEVWKALSSPEVGYCPPMIYDLAGKRQLIVWLTDAIYGLEPATGKQLWSVRYPSKGRIQRPAVTIACPRPWANQLIVTSFYNGAMLIEVTPGDPPTAKVVWESKSDNPMKPDTLSTTMTTPIFKGDYVYGICGFGELRCLDAKTGKQLWTQMDVVEKKKAFCGTAFIIPNGQRYFIWNDQGDLILADLTPEKYVEFGRVHLLEPVHEARGRNVVWSHPAFAQKCMFARNFKEIICVELGEPSAK